VCFGDHISTFQEYKTTVEDALAESKLRCKVEDVYAIVNYQYILAPCMDTKLSRLHKEEQTQLQWRFEAVKPSAYFPCGVKTTYRAYCSDKVVELVPKPKAECHSRMGSIIGLEPRTVYCRWYPTGLDDPTRPGIEGLYLLRAIPNVSEDGFVYCPFPEKTDASVQRTLFEVRTKWSMHDNPRIREDWDAWEKNYAPDTDDVDVYIERQKAKHIHINNPMHDTVFCDKFIVKFPDWSVQHATSSDEPYEWPDIVSIATNSVVSDFNRHPPDPRTFTVKSLDVMTRVEFFKLQTKEYYRRFDVRECTIEKVTKRMRQVITYNAKLVSTAGQKKTIIDRIYNRDLYFVTVVNKDLNPMQSHLISGVIDGELTSDTELDEVVTTIGTAVITVRNILSIFSNDGPSTDCMRGIVALFEKREGRLRVAYDDINRDGLFKKSFFLPIGSLLRLQYHPEEFLSMFPPGLDFQKVYRVYFLEKEGAIWRVVILEFISQTIFCFESAHLSRDLGSSPEILNKNISTTVHTFLRGSGIITPTDTWGCTMQHICNLNQGINNADGAIAIAAVIYFEIMDCPFAFRKEELGRFKKLFAFWLMDSMLPY
jgi:hypothetical protein